VSEQGAELSAFEYGLIVSSHAFERWIVRCAAAAGCGDLSSLDVLVLHSTNHRERKKRVGDICFVLNVEDTHTVTYALKKLVRMGLVDRRRQGKESFYGTSDEGRALCARYREIRENCLISALNALGLDEDAVADLADRLRALSGLYDQAARAATSL
jgi:predicted MarR family transcription regulator